MSVSNATMEIVTDLDMCNQLLDAKLLWIRRRWRAGGYSEWGLEECYHMPVTQQNLEYYEFGVLLEA